MIRNYFDVIIPMEVFRRLERVITELNIDV